MRKQQRSLLLALLTILTALAMVAAACGDDDDDSDSAATGTQAAPAVTEPAEAEPEEAAPVEAEPAEPEPAEPEPAEAAPVNAALPGEGVSVTMARADWATGYFQAQVYKQMLEELGYDVSEPSETELGPSLAYLAMAEGDIDFWTNSWYPGHAAWWEPELPDGSKVGDHLQKVGAVFRGGGLQGMLITKSVADEYGISYIDQINDDPEIRALFDSDGDGDADIYGCQESYTCDDIITNQILFSGWDNIDQTIAGYDAMFAEAVAKVDAGEPMVITPGHRVHTSLSYVPATTFIGSVCATPLTTPTRAALRAVNNTISGSIRTPLKRSVLTLVLSSVPPQPRLVSVRSAGCQPTFR